MKNKLILLVTLLILSPLSIAGNYVITIDGKEYDASLGKSEKITISGKSHSVKIEQKENLIYKTRNFSFEHSNKYSPSRNDLGGGIYQTAMMTPLGTVVMVQEYTSMNPSSMVDMMANEVTKEERDYGYKIKSRPESLTLSNGVKLTGKVISSKYKGSNIKRFIYTYGVKDAGVLILTQIDYEIASDEEKVLKKFFDSLLITMK